MVKVSLHEFLNTEPRVIVGANSESEVHVTLIESFRRYVRVPREDAPTESRIG